MEVVKEIPEDEISAFEKEEIATGNERTFRKVFNLYFNLLVLFATSLLKARDKATEIVNWVFVKFWQDRAKAPQIRNVKIFLYKSTKNAALNYLAKPRQRFWEDVDEVAADRRTAVNPEQQLIYKEMMIKINAAVEALPPRCKMVFKAVRENGLSYREAAGVLDLSVKTIDAQMVIAVKRIAESIKNDLDINRFQKNKKS